MAIPSKLNTQYSGGCMRYIVVKGIEYKSYMVDIYGDIYSVKGDGSLYRMTTHHSYKKVAQIDLSTNKIIKIWDGISLACRELGIYGSNIAKVCSGERNHAGGFGWKYI